MVGTPTATIPKTTGEPKREKGFISFGITGSGIRNNSIKLGTQPYRSMKKQSHHYYGLVCVVLLGLVCSAKGISIDITAVQLGSGAPPVTLGGYNMTPFGPDTSPDGTVVSSAGSI